MTDYVTVDEYARRICTLSSLFPNYCHRFPVLSWSYKYDYKELQKVLTNLGVPSRLYKGPIMILMGKMTKILALKLTLTTKFHMRYHPLTTH